MARPVLIASLAGVDRENMGNTILAQRRWDAGLKRKTHLDGKKPPRDNCKALAPISSFVILCASASLREIAAPETA